MGGKFGGGEGGSKGGASENCKKGARGGEPQKQNGRGLMAIGFYHTIQHTAVSCTAVLRYSTSSGVVGFGGCADRSETKIYDLVLFRNHSENSMTHISVMTHFLVRRVMCRIQLRITHPVFGWWGLLIYSAVYDDALPLCAPHIL
eukprot:SAG25_NODE_129_length_14495_cov_41.326202_4_plen_145_part_00